MSLVALDLQFAPLAPAADDAPAVDDAFAAWDAVDAAEPPPPLLHAASADSAIAPADAIVIRADTAR